MSMFVAHHVVVVVIHNCPIARPKVNIITNFIKVMNISTSTNSKSTDYELQISIPLYLATYGFSH